MSRIMTIFAGIPEFEPDLIRERTGAGRADAHKRGVRFGRPFPLLGVYQRVPLGKWNWQFGL